MQAHMSKFPKTLKCLAQIPHSYVIKKTSQLKNFHHCLNFPKLLKKSTIPWVFNAPILFNQFFFQLQQNITTPQLSAKIGIHNKPFNLHYQNLYESKQSCMS